MTHNRKIDPKLWDRTYLLNRCLSQQIRKVIEAYCPPGWQGRILDLGCGTKPYASLFEGRCGEYLGCDAYPADDTVVKCPADRLVFEDNAFDAVVSFQVLEHVPTPWLMMREISRVLRPGGWALLTAPFVFPHHSSPSDFYRYTHDGLRELAKQAGLGIEKIEAQLASLPTLVLLTSWYLGLVQGALGARQWGRPLAWSSVATLTVPLNLLGVALQRLPLGRDPIKRSNLGFANYLLVARKPG